MGSTMDAALNRGQEHRERQEKKKRKESIKITWHKVSRDFDTSPRSGLAPHRPATPKSRPKLPKPSKRPPTRRKPEGATEAGTGSPRKIFALVR